MRYKTLRFITKTVHVEMEIDKVPNFGIGDCLGVCSDFRAGHVFTVAEILYDNITEQFLYAEENGAWYMESVLNLVEKNKEKILDYSI